MQSSSSKGSQSSFGCKENNPKAGFTCGWYGYVASSALIPGGILEPAPYTLPSGCTSVAWKYAPDADDPNLNCTAVPDAGFAAEGSKNYVLFAELTCDDGTHVNACSPKNGWATRAAPTLTGTCKWDRTPPSTTTARGSKPSGVSVLDPDKVCSSPTVVYKYAAGTKDWNLTTGILSEWASWDKKHKETYSDVTPTLNCPAYSQTIEAETCAPLEVAAGADHIIECIGDFQGANCSEAKKTVTLKLDECVEINVLNYTQSQFLPSLIMRCDAQSTQQSVSVTLSLNGTPKTYTGSYVVLPNVELGKIKIGDNEFGTLCLTALSGATSVKCTGPGQ